MSRSCGRVRVVAEPLRVKHRRVPSSPSSFAPSPLASPVAAARPGSGVGEVPASGQNPLLHAAVPLLVLAGRLRSQGTQTDIANLRAQAVNEMRAFEDRLACRRRTGRGRDGRALRALHGHR